MTEDMTRERLEAYKSMKEEMAEIKYIMGQAGHCRQYNRYSDRLKVLEAECTAVEEFIEGIGDSMTRRIFRMYFLEGKRQKEIAKLVHMDRSMVSRKINTPALYSRGQ